MLALINTPVYEEVMEDINNVVFNVLPNTEAEIVYAMLEDMAAEGSTEEFLYNEMRELIKADNYVYQVYHDNLEPYEDNSYTVHRTFKDETEAIRYAIKANEDAGDDDGEYDVVKERVW